MPPRPERRRSWAGGGGRRAARRGMCTRSRCGSGRRSLARVAARTARAPRAGRRRRPRPAPCHGGAAPPCARGDGSVTKADGQDADARSQLTTSTPDAPDHAARRDDRRPCRDPPNPPLAARHATSTPRVARSRRSRTLLRLMFLAPLTHVDLASAGVAAEHECCARGSLLRSLRRISRRSIRRSRTPLRLMFARQRTHVDYSSTARVALAQAAALWFARSARSSRLLASRRSRRRQALRLVRRSPAAQMPRYVEYRSVEINVPGTAGAGRGSRPVPPASAEQRVARSGSETRPSRAPTCPAPAQARSACVGTAEERRRLRERQQMCIATTGRIMKFSTGWSTQDSFQCGQRQRRREAGDNVASGKARPRSHEARRWPETASAARRAATVSIGPPHPPAVAPTSKCAVTTSKLSRTEHDATAPTHRVTVMYRPVDRRQHGELAVEPRVCRGRAAEAFAPGRASSSEHDDAYRCRTRKPRNVVGERHEAQRHRWFTPLLRSDRLVQQSSLARGK